jgi:HPt (histidine-containing phosphotransfer) domain-containing protein
MSTEKIDLTYLNSVSGGDNGFVLHMLDLFLSSVPPEALVLEKAINENDMYAVGRSAHRMKATIQMIGEQELAGVVMRIEKIGKTGEGAGELTPLFESLKHLLQIAVAKVELTKQDFIA